MSVPECGGLSNSFGLPCDVDSFGVLHDMLRKKSKLICNETVYLADNVEEGFFTSGFFQTTTKQQSCRPRHDRL